MCAGIETKKKNNKMDISTDDFLDFEKGLHKPGSTFYNITVNSFGA